MRRPFISEERFIRNVLSRHGHVTLPKLGDIVEEYYADFPNSRGVRFNNDFVLQFVPHGKLANFASHCVSILPNTLGSELFVVFDKRTSMPLRTELMGGGAFPAKHFKKYIDRIEAELSALALQIDLRGGAYCRIFVVGNDICFLFFPTDPRPISIGGASSATMWSPINDRGFERGRSLGVCGRLDRDPCRANRFETRCNGDTKALQSRITWLRRSH